MVTITRLILQYCIEIEILETLFMARARKDLQSIGKTQQYKIDIS